MPNYKLKDMQKYGYDVFMKETENTITELTVHNDGECSVITYNKAHNPESLLSFMEAKDSNEKDWDNAWDVVVSHK